MPRKSYWTISTARVNNRQVNAAPDRIIDGVSYTHLSTLLLYIENQLGFSKEEQQQLRKKYTTTY